MRVVVGVGLIGVQFVNRLRDHGVEVAAGSLRTGIDAYSGRGPFGHVEGAEIVVDATNMDQPAYDYEQVHDLFEACTRFVLFAEHEAGVEQHLGVSMIGAPSTDSEFFRGKATQELLMSEAPTSHTLFRTTEFVPLFVDHAATTHLVPLPTVRVQPVAADDVAAEIDQALGKSLNGAFELTGPEVRFLDELPRQALAGVGDLRPIEADHAAFYLGARLEAGTDALLPSWRTGGLAGHRVAADADRHRNVRGVRSAPSRAARRWHRGAHRPHRRPNCSPLSRAHARVDRPLGTQRLLVPGARVTDLWHDLHEVARKIRPDWDDDMPGLRNWWDAGDRTPFYGQQSGAAAKSATSNTSTSNGQPPRWRSPSPRSIQESSPERSERTRRT